MARSERQKAAPAKKSRKRKATKRKRPVGRPTKLTKKLIEKVELEIARGARAKDAALLAGIPPRTFRDWMKKGREGKSKLLEEFAERVERSQATWRTELLRRIAEGTNIKGDPDWKALEALLRYDPELRASAVSAKAVEQRVMELFDEMDEHMSAGARSEMYEALAKVTGVDLEADG